MGGDVKRGYRSERRREQAEQTRERVLDAAARVFADRGFDATSIAAIAEEAGVSPETIYARFGNKRTLLTEVVSRAARGPEDGPILEQSGARAVAATSDQAAQLRLFADDISRRLERASPLVAVVGGASLADPELAALLERIHEARRSNLAALVGLLEANGALAVETEAATELVWTLTSPEVYRLLTHVRGWSRRRYAAWLTASLEAALLERVRDRPDGRGSRAARRR
jgi:AcrR family transcriptional regulator